MVLQCNFVKTSSCVRGNVPQTIATQSFSIYLFWPRLSKDGILCSGKFSPKNCNRVILCLFLWPRLRKNVILCWRKFTPKEMQQSFSVYFSGFEIVKIFSYFGERLPPKNCYTVIICKASILLT